MTEERKVQYDVTYMKMAYVISELSYAVRHKVGAIIVSKQGQIISQGYNGTPSGFDNCCEYVQKYKDECGCCSHGTLCELGGEIKNCNNCDGKYDTLVTRDEVLHAETNAISKCAKWMSSTQDATLYVTLSPCLDCAKMIVQSGIKRVVFAELYRNVAGIKLLNAVGIQVQQIDMDKNVLNTITYDS